MRKILSVILCATMLMGMSSIAFATNETNNRQTNPSRSVVFDANGNILTGSALEEYYVFMDNINKTAPSPRIDHDHRYMMMYNEVDGCNPNTPSPGKCTADVHRIAYLCRECNYWYENTSYDYVHTLNSYCWSNK